MCHFITATLPKGFDVQKTSEIFVRHNLRFEEVENDSVREQLEKGDRYILTTQGHCDCGTVLGSECRDEGVNDEKRAKFQEQAINKLKEKGWSKTKIERWQKEAQLTQEKENRSKELQHQFGVTLVSDWLDFITDILSSKVTPRIGLLLHMYDGSLSSRIKLLGKERIPLKNLNEDVLLQMREDVIYEFVSS